MAGQKQEEIRQQLTAPRRRNVAFFLLAGGIFMWVLAASSAHACDLISSWNSTQCTGYIAAIVILAFALIGPRFAKTYLVYHQIFRFMAYCAIFIFILTLCYSMVIDILGRMQNANQSQAQKIHRQATISAETPPLTKVHED